MATRNGPRDANDMAKETKAKEAKDKQGGQKTPSAGNDAAHRSEMIAHDMELGYSAKEAQVRADTGYNKDGSLVDRGFEKAVESRARDLGVTPKDLIDAARPNFGFPDNYHFIDPNYGVNLTNAAKMHQVLRESSLLSQDAVNAPKGGVTIGGPGTLGIPGYETGNWTYYDPTTRTHRIQFDFQKPDSYFDTQGLLDGKRVPLSDRHKVVHELEHFFQNAGINPQAADPAPGAFIDGPLGTYHARRVNEVLRELDQQGITAGPQRAIYPIVLDLTGGGINIEQHDSSNQFFDMAGDGRQYRTAWAGLGNGVLAIDSNGDGTITERKEIVFSDWDPSAKSDMEALRAVFDTDNDGYLTAADDRFADFRIVRTNADGTTTTLTLDEIGIKSIKLTLDSADVRLSDGSSIQGTTTFTWADDSVGKAASVGLAGDTDGKILDHQEVTNLDDSVTITNATYAIDGSFSGRIETTSSADGSLRIARFDLDGDGVYERIETLAKVLGAGASVIETRSVTNGGGVLEEATQTTRSATGDLLSILRDDRGSGYYTSAEYHTYPTGFHVVVEQRLNPDGTAVNNQTTTYSTDGFARTVDIDLNGDGIVDIKTSDVTVESLIDKSRVQTIDMRAGDNSLVSRTVIETDGAGETRTTKSDIDGDGVFDFFVTATVTELLNGDKTIVEEKKSRNGDIIATQMTQTRADGLWRQVSIDADGDGTAEIVQIEETILHVAGSRDVVITVKNANADLLEETRTFIDGKETVYTFDRDGDGFTDLSKTVTHNGDGTFTELSRDLQKDGSISWRESVTTSNNGLSVRIRSDEDANNLFETDVTETTSLDILGNTTIVTETRNLDGSMRGAQEFWLSANGMISEVKVDIDANGSYDFTTNAQKIMAAGGAVNEIKVSTYGDGSLAARETSTISKSRDARHSEADENGDGSIDSTASFTRKENGETVTTEITYDADGSVINRIVTTISANSFDSEVELDYNGDNVVDRRDSAVQHLAADGSISLLKTIAAGSGKVISTFVTEKSASGDVLTLKDDLNGDGSFDFVTVSTTTISNDGSKIILQEKKNTNGIAIDRLLETVSSDGLTVERLYDSDGAGGYELKTIETTTRNDDGSITKTVNTWRNGNLAIEVETTTSHDGSSVNEISHWHGAVPMSQTYERSVGLDGTVTETTRNYNSADELVSRIDTTTNPTGLVVTNALDIDGDGNVDITEIDETILNANGSQTKTITRSTLAGNFQAERETVSGNGLVTTSEMDMDGNGSWDTKRIVSRVINANGSETLTSTEINADGSVRSIRTVIASGDRRSATETYVVGAITITSRVSTLGADGNQVDVVTTRNPSNAIVSTVTTTTASNGLYQQVQTKNGAGTVIDTQTTTTVLNADGSRTETLNQAGGINGTTVTTISADQTAKTVQSNLTGAATIATTSKKTQSITADGLITTDTVVVNADGSLRDIAKLVKTDDGRIASISLDYNGDGRSDIVSTSNLLQDGRLIETHLVNQVGINALLHSASTQTSADGNVVTTMRDRNGDGVIDLTVVTTRKPDGSVVENRTSVGINGAPAYSQEFVTASNENGGITVTKTYRDGFGGITGTSVTTENANFTLTETVHDVNGDGAADKNTTTSVAYNADGTVTETTVTTIAGGVLASKRVTTTSADGSIVTTQVDLDGNGIAESAVSVTTCLDGSIISTSTAFNNDTGAQTSQRTVTFGANQIFQESPETLQYFVWKLLDGDAQGAMGAISSRAKNFQDDTPAEWVLTVQNVTLLDKMTIFVGNNGSNQWVRTLGGASVASASHIIDANNVETWTWDISNPTNWASTSSMPIILASGSITIDLATKAKFITRAGLVYETALGRSMSADEEHVLAQYIQNGHLNENLLATNIIASTEFTTKYATLTDSAFVTRMYMNAIGHQPTDAVRDFYLAKLTSGQLGRSDLMKAFATLAEEGQTTKGTWLNGTLGDTVSYHDVAAGVTVDLTTIANNTGAAAGDTYAVVTDVIGSSFNDSLKGDGKNNTLTGGAGADVLDGAGGTDTASYENASTGLTVNLLVPSSNNGDAAGDTYIAIENLRGSSFDDTLVGNASVNRIEGGVGNDIIDGGAAADVMVGGTGDDYYYVSVAGDSIIEDKNAGYDIAEGAVTFTMDSNVEEGRAAVGTTAIGITGNASDNKIIGNDAANALSGSDGNDLLVGGLGNDTLTGGNGNDTLDGGFGNDAMTGGAGDDLYIADSTTDTAVEAVAGGTDIVQSSATFTLGVNVENLTLTGSGNINGAGNVLDNVIIGNVGTNALSGGDGNDYLDGGGGADAMTGGLGNDTFVVDNAGDTVVEATSAGTDTVNSSIDFSLAALSNVENVTLIGSGNINATGNTAANALVGNSGANNLSGGDGDDFLQGGTGADTLSGGIGNDTANYAGSSAAVTVSLVAGTGLGGDADGDTLSGIENLTGSANEDVLTGDAAANILDGGAGKDSLAGGTGNDTYLVDNVDDVITENASEGTDTVVSTAATYTLAANVDNLTLGGAGNINGTGNDDANILTGNAGNNRLDAKGGVDSMAGGLGDDTYVVDNAGDVVVEGASAGTDTVESSITYSIASLANLENVTLTGTASINATGNTTANTLIGNDGSNTLNGGAGNDILIGGNGGDTLVGGTNTDTASYVNATAGVAANMLTQIGTGDALNDTYNTIENLTGSSYDDDLTGDGAANVISGGAGNDRLSGGLGTDTLAGGIGNDTYIYDGVDTLTEAANEGIDTVEVTANYALLANFENLTLGGTAATGTGNTHDNRIVGNASVNTLTGNDGNDVLEGGAANDTLSGGNGNDALDGGIGNDSMTGGLGDDTFIVDSTTDVVTEAGAGGTDTVKTGVTLTILAANVENLVLTGSATINATGNILDNVITGNEAANTLDGGAGNDTIDGAAGNDTFIAGAGNDVFVGGDGVDTLNLSGSHLDYQFTDLGGGVTEVKDLRGSSPDGTKKFAGIEKIVFLGDVAPSGGIISGTNDADSLAGDSGDNLILGLIGNDTITGDAGNDVLNGGLGKDSLTGGLGNDTYVVDQVGDTVLELSGEGTDTVVASISYALGENFENLLLIGPDSINATGNTDANTITGNAGDNLIDGGAGIDVMVGGKGNDTYVVDQTGETVTELTSEGTDTVRAAINYDISALTNIENVTLTGSALTAIGNAGANVLTGTGGANTLTGNDGEDILIGGAGADSLIGGNGNDTASYVDATAAVTANLLTSALNTGDAAGDTYTTIENLTGSAFNDVLTGNDAVNTLSGGAGNDRLMGGLGADILIGGTGDDTYVITATSGTEVVTELADGGSDTVESELAHTLSANVENLILTGTGAIGGTGNALNNRITGNSGNNTLSGGAGADWLDGGAGNDSLTGGADDDTYIVGSTGDIVTESANQGIDTVVSSVSYTLSANVEHLIINSASNRSGTGNALDNTIIGGSGNDTLAGLAGADRLDGGIGVDIATYATSNAAVSVSLKNGFARGGHADGDVLFNFEILYGSAYGDFLEGDDQDNTITGLAGADTMVGQGGNDTYSVDNVGDTVTEAADGGLDLVYTSVNYTLSEHLENMTAAVGSAAINLTGNSGNNTLTGNDLANVISGGDGDDTVLGNDGNDTLSGGTGNDSLTGGLGNDAMSGGVGDDYYSVDSATDTVTENVGEGIDRVYSTINYTLGANVEKLTLGSGTINGTGNALDNVITGGSGANILTGGAGADQLSGGGGNDTASYTGSTAAVSVNLKTGSTSGGDAAGDTFVSIENLSGSAFNDTLTGGDGANIIDGGVGVDIMTGGAGNDTYYIENVGDTILELSNDRGDDGLSGGTDLVYSSINYTLLDYVEDLTLTSSAITGTGNNLSNKITGNASANTLIGFDGSDTLDGAAGADTMVGGTGDDTYYVDNTGDIVTESADEGADTIRSTATYTASAHVENMIAEGATAINLTGNTLDNALTGNSGNNILTGGDGNDILIGGIGTDTLSGGNGNDTASYATATAAVTVSLAAGTASGADGADTLSSIENLIGGGYGDILTGNAVANRIDGGAGNDTMTGGAGDDIYIVSAAGDTIVENANEGTDTIQSSVSITALAANVENLILANGVTGTGNALNNQITGNGSANTLSGADGNDTLDGGVGADSMNGGLGDDTFYVDNAGDTVTEAASQGTDVVYASVSYTLAANVENLIMSGSALIGTGNGLDNQITGNDLDNSLAGGVGADKLSGGLGTDTASYASSAAGVTINLQAATASGGDAAGDILTSIENLIGSAQADSLTGDGNDNLIQGGAGSDTLAGGLGNDTLSYAGSTAAVTVNLAAGTFSGGDAAGDTATDFENLIGGNGNDILTGNSGDNRIDGGTGNDTMTGAAGNDVYIVNATGDVVVEGSSAGTDTIMTSVTLTSLAANVENLVLTGSGNLNATGNSLVNVITGNSGANVLTGGAGADTLDGGDGIDTAAYVGSGSAVTVNLAEGTAIGGDAQGDTLLNTENLNGSSFNDDLTGNVTANVIDGGAGDDTMTGGAGDDTYYVAQAGDSILEGGGGGTDLVISTITYTLSDQIENLTLTGSSNINGTGNAANNVLTGNSGKNTLTGGDGDDTLDGGSAADVMIGGAGNDVYYVAQASDVVTELTDEGIDTVYSGIAFALGNNIENLTLTGENNIDLNGNDLDNILIGNVGNNTFYSSAGADTFDGGGADTIDGDVLTYVNSNAAINLNLTTGIGQGGHAQGDKVSNISVVIGSAFNDTIVGTSTAEYLHGGDGNDYLSGANSGNDELFGDAGDDTLVAPNAIWMEGGSGNDTYILNYDYEEEYATHENANEGIDTIITDSQLFTLQDNFENLTIRYGFAETAVGTGNSLDNVMTTLYGGELYGHDGNDTLVAANTGINYLVGGSGNDHYISGNSMVDMYIYNSGNDTIDAYDTNGGEDRLTLSGISSENLWLHRANDDLVISVIGSDNSITVEGWYTSKDHKLDAIYAGGKTLSTNEAETLVHAMAAFTPPAPGMNFVALAAREAMAPVIAAAW